MKLGLWQWLKRLPALLETPQLEPAEHAQRIVSLQRNILLPARLLVVVAVFLQIHSSKWLTNVVTSYGVLFETVVTTLAACAAVMLAVTVLFYVVRRFPPRAVQWVVFTSGLADAVFLGGLTVLTQGFESPLYWVYPALIVLNAISIPLATPQIVLNLMLCIIFLAAGLVEASTPADLQLASFRKRAPKEKVAATDIKDVQAVVTWLRNSPEPMQKLLLQPMSDDTRAALASGTNLAVAGTNFTTALVRDLNLVFSPPTRFFTDGRAEPVEPAADPYVLRVAVLLLVTFCCYGLQLLLARQRIALDERQEFLVRTEQLRAAGRLAAEVAHQIKNPLAIINNAAFTLARDEKSPENSQPLQIIREEVAKADRIITQIMGYAQLSEGRVEKLDILEELNRAIEQVFPPAITAGINVRRDFVAEFPPLLMQRRHFSESLVNLLQNAREALDGQAGKEPRGEVTVRAVCHRDYSVEISVSDTGPGIAPDQHERIFEAYHTTKEKGTGLGLSLVKHNVELYGGTVRVESELGRGACFILLFPAKALIKLGQ